SSRCCRCGRREVVDGPAQRVAASWRAARRCARHQQQMATRAELPGAGNRRASARSQSAARSGAARPGSARRVRAGMAGAHRHGVGAAPQLRSAMVRLRDCRHRAVHRARVPARSAARRAVEMTTPTAAPRARKQIWILIALFFAPLALAFLLYYGGGWRPPGSTNKGELISPPRPLPDGAAWHGKWTLVYVGDGRCDEQCRAALLLTRQTRLALNADMTRVQRIFLATGNCCDR